MRNFPWVVCLGLSIAACGGGDDLAGLGEECGPSKACQSGLICDPIQHICVDKDSFHPDAAGSSIDAGNEPNPPPDTRITSGPDGFTHDSPVVFAFTSTKSPSTFQCQLDDGDFEACTSPQSYADLSDGPHTFRVKAIDADNQEDPTPAIADFTLDTAPPDTTITAGPTGDVASSEAVFSFTCTTPPCTFQCQLDAGAFADCDSGAAFDVTATGSHTFRVKAIDQAGNEDPSPAERTWNVTALSLQTLIVTAPPLATQSGDASFSFECRFAGEPANCTFQCALDGADPTACTSPTRFTNLAEAVHTFTVVGTRVGDSLTDPTPASHTWRVDRTPPVVTITKPTPGEITGPRVTFAYTADEPATFECDTGDGFETCAEGGFERTFNSGARTLSVKATDGALNVSAPKSVTFTVDADGPVITLVAPGATTGVNTTLDFTFTDLSPPVTFTCDLGGGMFDCADGTQLPPQTAGPKTLILVGTDKWGNKTTRTVTFTVDATGPTVNLVAPLPGALVPGTGSITWAVPTNDAVRTVCTIDGSELPCSGTSLAYTLDSGEHTFEVVAFDQFDNPSVEPPSSQRTTFTVDADRPVVVAGQPDSVCAPITIPFDSDNPGEQISFSCSLNNAAFTGCNRPGITFTAAQLVNGANSLRIIATDEVGNTSEQPGVVNFTADLAGPVLTAPVTTGPANTGQATITFVTNEPLEGLSAETHVATPDGDDVTRVCGCEDASCSCSLLAAHNNVIHARAVDACGNPSSPTAAAPADTVGTIVAPFTTNEGHVVLIGHDYSDLSENPAEAILVDAVRLAPFVHRDYAPVFPSDARPIRVLVFRDADTGSESGTELANIQSLLSSDTVSVSVFDNPADLADLLPGYDVLLVADQNTRAGLPAISTAWTPILTPFLNDGGIVVVSAGEVVDGGPNATHQIIGGLLSVASVVSGDGLFGSNDDVFASLRYFFFDEGDGPDPAFWVSQNIPVSYNFPPSSVGYVLSDSGQPTTVVEMLATSFGCGKGCGIAAGLVPGGPPQVDQRFALVVDKVYPVYNIGFTLTGPTGTDFNGNTLPVIDAAGTFDYTLGSVGQTRVDCRAFTRDFFNFGGPTVCGSDTPPAGTFAYDLSNPSCPTCVDDVYRFDLVAVTASTVFDGGEGARAGSSGFVFVDGGAFADVIGPINTTMLVFGSFEPLPLATFNCTLFQNVAGAPPQQIDSRRCDCPQSPPAACDPGPLPGPGNPFGSYDFGGLPLNGSYFLRVDVTDGLGHVFQADSAAFTVDASVTVTATNPADVLVCGGTLPISFPFTLGAEPSGYNSISCVVRNSQGVVVASSATCASLSASGAQTFTTGNLSVDTYTFRVDVQDAAGNNGFATSTGSVAFDPDCITKPRQ